MNDEVINSILDVLREFVNIEEIGESKARMAIRIQVRKSLNYMNREDFPQELVELLAEAMALEYMEDNNKEVKSIQAGDARVDYNTSTPTKDLTITSMKEQLRRFRKVGVIKHGTTKE
ncbi:hypothetical protein [Fusobacterium necrogenes]|uniref:hypothetical protein n=1 Tax=Fusobacterium necrogenes TaxID=858 RepID=UPI00255C69FE|nr:hypothetical protein [Fusobacterium necrogenes]